MEKFFEQNNQNDLHRDSLVWFLAEVARNLREGKQITTEDLKILSLRYDSLLDLNFTELKETVKDFNREFNLMGRPGSEKTKEVIAQVLDFVEGEDSETCGK